MVYPVYINIITTLNNVQCIVRTILDLHPSQLTKVVSQPDGLVSVRDLEGNWYKLGITFDELFELLDELYPIDKRYKDRVDSFSKNEYEGLRNSLNNDKDGAESD